jgi:hypothetical protein
VAGSDHVRADGAADRARTNDGQVHGHTAVIGRSPAR